MSNHQNNFKTLEDAFTWGDVTLLECRLKSTGEKVAVICALSVGPDGQTQMVPMAMLFNGNPYELLSSPNPDGFRKEEE